MRRGDSMSGCLFNHPLESWEDWGLVFHDREAFLPLVWAIYSNEGFAPPDALGDMTPGTNAVFRVGDTVVKIFAPVSIGTDFERDYVVETAMLAHAAKAGIPTTTLLAHGVLPDRYAFRYMMLAYVEAPQAHEALACMGAEGKRRFAGQMRRICEMLHHPAPGLLPAVDLRKRALENEHLLWLPEALRTNMQAHAQRVTWQEDVAVHGDLTGDNVLVRKDGPVILDFADAVMGPWWYELAPLVFELFACDEPLVHAYLDGEDCEPLIQRTLDALSLHDFGANILIDWARRENLSLDQYATLQAVGEWLRKKWHRP